MKWIPLGLLFCFLFSGLAEAKEPRIRVEWASGQIRKELKSWTYLELAQWKTKDIVQSSPALSKNSSWEAIRLDALIEIALLELSLKEQSKVDFLILKNRKNQRITIPRWFVKKYPVMLATGKGKVFKEFLDLKNKGPFHSIVELTNFSQMQSERVPVLNYFLNEVATIVLANQKDYYRSFFLKERGDPLAVRGEGVFIRACLNCHTDGKVRSIDPSEHKRVAGLPPFNRLDQLGLKRYFRDFMRENSGNHPADLSVAFK